MTQTSKLIDFIHRTEFSNLPDTIVAMAERCCLDLIGVCAAGRKTKASEIAHNMATNLYGSNILKSAITFSDQSASPAGAAFAGAITIDAFDAHDGHRLTKGHAGVAILPSILAVMTAEEGQKKTFTGQDFLTALAIGYEISLRAGIALHATTSDYHTSGAWNAIGAAAVSARLLNLDKEQTRHALGIAEFYGPRSQMMRCIDHPTMLKDGSGWGAMAGVSAAYFARDGFTGAPAVTLESDECEIFWQDLGSDWEMNAQYFKPMPVCRWAQPALEAIQELRTRHALPPEEIDTIHVTTFHEALRLSGHNPQTTEEAQYAIAFPLAALICRGKVGMAEISEEGLNDPQIKTLSRKIILRESEKYNKLFPAERWADVSVTLKSGDVLQTPPTCPIGDPENPLSDQQISDKFHLNCQEIMAKPQSKEIEQAVKKLRREDSKFTAFLSLLK